MFNLATAKTRLGISDTSKDTLIQSALSSAVAIAERYCGRLFAYAAETATFYHFEGSIIFLPRYPIQAVISTSGLPDVKIHHTMGTLELDYTAAIDEFTVNYSGGYQAYPADLELALWGIFDNVYPAMSAAAPAAIESVTIPDVGTVRYAANTIVPGADANVLGAFYTILDGYRRLTC